MKSAQTANCSDLAESFSLSLSLSFSSSPFNRAHVISIPLFLSPRSTPFIPWPPSLEKLFLFLFAHRLPLFVPDLEVLHAKMLSVVLRVRHPTHSVLHRPSRLKQQLGEGPGHRVEDVPTRPGVRWHRGPPLRDSHIQRGQNGVDLLDCGFLDDLLRRSPVAALPFLFGLLSFPG